MELQDWVSAFQTVAFDKGEEVCRLSSSYHTEEFEESNDLYCSANEGKNIHARMLILAVDMSCSK
jgi:hypothetical protein